MVSPDEKIIRETLSQIEHLALLSDHSLNNWFIGSPGKTKVNVENNALENYKNVKDLLANSTYI